MQIEFDPEKNEINQSKHGLDFADVCFLDWDGALFKEDSRHDYGETRYIAYVTKRKRLYIVCLTFRGNSLRILSFRKANKREVAYYEQETADR